jgi:hypothetical protein
MKRTILPFLLLILTGFTLSGCQKKLTHFYVDYESETVVPSTIIIGFPVSLHTPELETNSTYEFENKKTRKDLIQDIFLKKLRLTITDPDTETFSFVNSIQLYISTTMLDEVKIAELNDIPADVGNELELNTLDTDLKEYIKAEKFKLRLRVLSDETIPQDVHIDIYSQFLVDAQLIRLKKKKK